MKFLFNNNTLTQKPEREKPNDLIYHRMRWYTRTEAPDAWEEILEYEAYIKTLPTYPASPEFIRWAKENPKEEYELGKDFGLNLIGASWCKHCHDYADTLCVSTHINSIDKNRIVAVPLSSKDDEKGVASEHPEATCKMCGTSNPFWTAENNLFNRVNGSPYGIMCPNCFIKMANEKQVDVIIVERQSGRSNEQGLEQTQSTDQYRPAVKCIGCGEIIEINYCKTCQKDWES